MIEPRPFQWHDLERLRAAFRAGLRCVVYVAPTGSGKTATSCFMVHGAVQKGHRVMFVAHRKELIEQASARLDLYGLDHGIIMAKHPRRRPSAPVQVCSIQTLARRKALPPADLLIVDECHHVAGESYRALLDRYPKARIIGLTATPTRLDGRGLRPPFEDMVISLSPADLTQQGYLVPTRVFAPYSPDLKGIHSRGGDYKDDEIQNLMDVPAITGDVVQHWLTHARGRKTIVFATGVRHSIHLVDTFKQSGVRAAHIDAHTPTPTRSWAFNALLDGELEILSNCGILTEGVDLPLVSCVSLVRPTRSLVLYLQMIGRGTRPNPGKDDLLILDHAGNTLRHGFLTDRRAWSLDGIERKEKTEDNGPAITICKACFAAYFSHLGACPYCGAPTPKRDIEVKEKDGELVELDQRRNYTIRRLSQWPMIRRLQITAKEMDYKPGWVWRQLERLRRGLKPEIPERAEKIFANAK